MHIDVSRTTCTNLEVKQERRSMFIGISMGPEICLIVGQVTQCTLLEGKPPDGYVWSGERSTRKQLTSRPDHLWPENLEANGKECQAEGEAKVVE